MMDKRERMKELAELLNRAARAYYQEDREIMSNLEYDRLYDELEALETETKVVLAGRPTGKVGSEAVDELWYLPRGWILKIPEPARWSG